MKANCPRHGDYNLDSYTLPECPACIRARMKFPDGDDPKHFPTNAANVGRFKSFRSDQITAKAIFDYMSSGDVSNPTGCKIYYYPAENSFNAVSREPYGMIPGSGAKAGSGFAAHLAVLQDITGKSLKGPHFAYEDIPHFEMRIRNGEWIEAPKCVSCSTVYVYAPDGICPACAR